MYQRLLTFSMLIILCISMTLTPVEAGQSTISASPQAFPYLPGFPRTDPTDTGFSSPSVIDMNGDGRLDVLTADSNGCVWGWNDQGNLLPGFPITSTGGCSISARINSPLAIADITGNGRPEIVAGTRGTGTAVGERGKVFVWQAYGALLPGWPKEMAWNPTGNGGAEVYGITLANVAGDGLLEVVAGTSNNSTNMADTDTPNLYVWHSDGTMVPGYPTSYRTAGIYGNIGAANLVGNEYAEVVAGRDHLYIHAYDSQGTYVPGWPVRTYLDAAKTDFKTDPYIEFTENPPSMGDLDGDGTTEIVIAGKLRKPTEGHAVTNAVVMVIQPDGKRRTGWIIPALGGGRVANDFLPGQAVALADIDGNGRLEIIVTLFDGYLRVYQDNGSELWNYNFAAGQALFGSEPVIGDIDNDGRLDIVFGTYSPDGSAHSAAGIHALNADGQPLAGFPLPLTHEEGQKQGVRAAPTLADLDGNGTVEIIAATQGGALYVWDLPGAYASERMPWPTGRHDNLRSGTSGTVAPPLIELTAQAYLPLMQR